MPYSLNPTKIPDIATYPLFLPQNFAEEPKKGTFKVKTEQFDDEAHIVFENSGTPIPSDHLEKIFGPFFTSKEFREGTGLGLSLSYGIIKEHGGRI